MDGKKIMSLHNKTTQEYYSRFLFFDEKINTHGDVSFLCTSKRNIALKGYSKPHTICLCPCQPQNTQKFQDGNTQEM